MAFYINIVHLHVITHITGENLDQRVQTPSAYPQITHPLKHLPTHPSPHLPIHTLRNAHPHPLTDLQLRHAVMNCPWTTWH